MKKEALIAAQNAFGIEATEINRAKEVMDWDAFAKAVEALAKAERIGTAGCGHSGICCTHFAHSLCCVERPARFISPAEAVHGAMGFIQKGDVMVLASRGGKTAELIPIMNIARTKGATIISVTEKMDSPLAQGSDIVIPMKVELETDKYNSQSTSSFVALASVFDALQTALIEETGFVNEQFALTHPGGAVGERLNKK
ncbi:MAG: SIS domain-containing protein [Ruminococcaceae bacterium]|nr:SIS domain-containing protein [Oscillospiraceae bacterium]